jgi:hypothetical protein
VAHNSFSTNDSPVHSSFIANENNNDNPENSNNESPSAAINEEHHTEEDPFAFQYLSELSNVAEKLNIAQDNKRVEKTSSSPTMNDYPYNNPPRQEKKYLYSYMNLLFKQ